MEAYRERKNKEQKIERGQRGSVMERHKISESYTG